MEEKLVSIKELIAILVPLLTGIILALSVAQDADPQTQMWIEIVILLISGIISLLFWGISKFIKLSKCRSLIESLKKENAGKASVIDERRIYIRQLESRIGQQSQTISLLSTMQLSTIKHEEKFQLIEDILKQEGLHERLPRNKNN